jgi:hypothetical protein
MEQYLLLNAQKVKIGSKKVETRAHYDWNQAMRAIREEEAYGGWVLTPRPKEPEEWEEEPIYTIIPRIIAVSPNETTLRIKYGDQIYDTTDEKEKALLYGKDFLWIEKLTIKDDKIVEVESHTFGEDDE